MKLGKMMTKILKEQMTAGLLEEGFYTLKVESAEYGVSSDGKSKRAIVNFSVVGTEYEGYEIKSVFSLDNPSNQKSERISQKLFATMLNSANITVEDMTEDFDMNMLIGRNVKAYVIIEPSSKDYPAQNRVKYFK